MENEPVRGLRIVAGENGMVQLFWVMQSGDVMSVDMKAEDAEQMARKLFLTAYAACGYTPGIAQFEKVRGWRLR